MKKLMLTVAALLVILTIALAGCNESMSKDNNMATHVESWQMTPAGVYIPQY